jgi:hypothetical protein
MIIRGFAPTTDEDVFYRPDITGSCAPAFLVYLERINGLRIISSFTIAQHSRTINMCAMQPRRPCGQV